MSEELKHKILCFIYDDYDLLEITEERYGPDMDIPYDRANCIFRKFKIKTSRICKNLNISMDMLIEELTPNLEADIPNFPAGFFISNDKKWIIFKSQRGFKRVEETPSEQ